MAMAVISWAADCPAFVDDELSVLMASSLTSVLTGFGICSIHLAWTSRKRVASRKVREFLRARPAAVRISALELSFDNS
jgi:hypothetical protein